MEIFAFPMDWKKLVITIWIPIIGNMVTDIRKAFVAMLCNSTSLVNIEAMTEGIKVPITKPIVERPVATTTAYFNVRNIRPYCLAPKLYPIIGCVPWFNPMINITTNVFTLLIMPNAPIARSPP